MVFDLLRVRLMNNTDIARRLVAIARDLTAFNDENSLDGMSNAKARREVQNVLRRNTPRGILRDEYWKGPQQVWKSLDAAAFDWVITDNFYTKEDGVPVRKTWKFEIYFTNDKGRKTTIYGTLIASGAGSVDDPLEAYDVIVTAS